MIGMKLFLTGVVLLVVCVLWIMIDEPRKHIPRSICGLMIFGSLVLIVVGMLVGIWV